MLGKFCRLPPADDPLVFAGDDTDFVTTAPPPDVPSAASWTVCNPTVTNRAAIRMTNSILFCSIVRTYGSDTSLTILLLTKLI